MSVGSISVVIPAFNAGRFLTDALDSVEQQTLRPGECIVVDDGSSDATRRIADLHPACTRCLSQPNRGVSAARNAGARDAQGSLLAFLDSDDVWFPRRLEQTVRRMAREDVQAVLCATLLADETLRPVGRLEMDREVSTGLLLLRRASVVSTSSNLLIQREAFDRIGCFHPDLSTSADWHLIFRIVAELKWSFEPDPLVVYRSHRGGMSRNVTQMAYEMKRSYAEIFIDGNRRHGVSRRRAEGALHRELAGSYFVSGQLRECLRHGILSVWLAPGEIGYIGSAVARVAVRSLLRASVRGDT